MGDMIWVLIPLTALLIPIVAMLVSHQQKMAQIIHGRGDPEEVAALRSEVAELKQQLGQHTMALDEMRRRQPLPPTVEQR